MKPVSPIGTGSRASLVFIASRIAKSLSMAALSGGMLCLVWLYGNALRDPRYLDGWLLAGGMSLQLGFHIALKFSKLSPKLFTAFRQFHIFLGLILIAAFISHSDFSLPDTGFEWLLWTGFVLVTISGVSCTYLARLQAAERSGGVITGDERLALRHAELIEAVAAAVAAPDPPATVTFLPAPPHRAWILDLYENRLTDFFQKPGGVVAQFTGSQRRLKHLTDEIDNLLSYVEGPNQERLAVIKALVIEKEQLDSALAYGRLAKGCILVHVSVTYALVVLTVLHVLVVYAFSSGDW